MNDAPDDDPLWLNSPHKRRLFRGACYVAFIALCAGMFTLVIHPPWGPLLGATVGLWFVVSARQWVMTWLRDGMALLRFSSHRKQEGFHHSFAGQTLHLHDDGREMWLDERSVRALLQLQHDRALKARFANQWRSASELGLRGNGLWVRAVAVHQHLAEAPERMDPKRLRLRTYLDRDVIQPAARRHARGG
jgi:hypothetical protein